MRLLVLVGTLVIHVFGAPYFKCKSLDPEYKTTHFFQMHFQIKSTVLYLEQYGDIILMK